MKAYAYLALVVAVLGALWGVYMVMRDVNPYRRRTMLTQQSTDDKIYPLLEIRYAEYESGEWAELSAQGWRTVWVYELDNTAIMLFQKYLH